MLIKVGVLFYFQLCRYILQDVMGTIESKECLEILQKCLLQFVQGKLELVKCLIMHLYQMKNNK